jgi:hypothetical protein
MIEFDSKIDKTLPGYRLITVSGRAGSGRTHLITAFGRKNIQFFPYGVYYIDLAGLTTQSELVARVTALILEVPLRNADNPAEVIAETLRGHQALLLFDNCDRLVPAVANLLGTLLARAPHVMAMAVSNDALGIPGEIIRPITSLALPPPDGTGRTIRKATIVFSTYAQAANEKFEFNADSATQVNQICRDLDGVPLALILAASLLSEFTLDQLAHEIRTRLPRAQEGRRTPKEHDHMLRSLTEWHHALLDRAHKKTFRRISIFRGSFSLFYACFITGPDKDLKPVIQKMLDGWVKKGLLTTETGTRVLGRFGKPFIPEQIRYGMQSPVWSYAREALAKYIEHQSIAKVRNVLFGGSLGLTDLPGMTPVKWAKRNQPELENFYASLEHEQMWPQEIGSANPDREPFSNVIKRGLHDFWELMDEGAEQTQQMIRMQDSAILRPKAETSDIWDEMVMASRQAARAHQAD